MEKAGTKSCKNIDDWRGKLEQCACETCLHVWFYPGSLWLTMVREVVSGG